MNFDKEAFKKSLDEDLANPNGYWNTIKKKQELAKKRFDKFDQLLESGKLDFDQIFERLVNEHDDAYRSKCYKNGYEPYPNNKMTFILDYVNDRGEKIDTPDFIGNDFPTATILFKDRYWATTFGQGSFTHIYDLNEKRLLTV